MIFHEPGNAPTCPGVHQGRKSPELPPKGLSTTGSAPPGAPGAAWGHVPLAW